VPLVFEIARDAVRRVRLNLLWAFGYNAIGLTLAVMGLLTPIFAASAMVVSSLLIVVTSTRSAHDVTQTKLTHATSDNTPLSTIKSAIAAATA